MRVFTAGLITESTSFSPFRTGLDDFERARPAGKLLGALVGGVLDVYRARAEARGWSVTEGLAAGAMPGGPVTRAAYATLRAELLRSVDAGLPADVILLFLHGAMLADGEDDPEGDILEAVRARVGPTVPIGVLFDPHANLTDRMVRNADILVAFKEWPHVDILERAAEVFDLTARVRDGSLRPARAVFDCRMVSLYHTMESPTRDLLQDIRAQEGKDGIASISFVHGYPFADVPDAGTRMLVTAHDDPALAARVAEALGRRVFAMRGNTHPRHLDLAAGLERIRAAAEFPAVVADISDAPGAGAPGDATFILKSLLELGYEGAAFAYLWDPVMTQVAMRAGDGAEMDLRIGGKMGPVSGSPLDVRARVVRAIPGATVRDRGQTIPVGDLAVVAVNGIEIILSRERPVATSAEHFRAAGIDPAARRVLVVKSVNNFRAGFESIAGEFIYIAGPGALSTDLSLHPFRRIARPRWPFDAEPFA